MSIEARTFIAKALSFYPIRTRKFVFDSLRETPEGNIKKDWWPSLFSNSLEYSNQLLGDFPSNSFKSIVDAKKQRGDFYLLDLFSYGAIHRELRVPGCAVALSDRRRAGEHKKDLELRAELIVGNILRGKTWRKISDYLENVAGGRKFDVIVSNPLAGLTNIPADLGVYSYILNRVYGILNPNEGILITAYHFSMEKEVINAGKQLNRIKGLKVVVNPALPSGSFILARSPSSPEVLPDISALS